MNKQDLYRQIIISNSTEPTNLVVSPPHGYKKIRAVSDACAEVYDIFIKLEEGQIMDVKFSGAGCVISKAALNLVCSMIKAKPTNEAIALIANYQQMVLKKRFNKAKVLDLIIFENISIHLNRINCALLGANKIMEMLRVESK